MSHLGRPNGSAKPEFSLKPVIPTLERILGRKVNFLENCVGKETESYCQNIQNGEVVLLENLRYHEEEEGSRKDENGKKIKADSNSITNFRKSLTSLGDIYVNDAFGTSHRAHSSIVGVNHQIKAAGYLLKKELDYFAKALESPQKPFLVILGGAKVKDKIPLITSLLDRVDEMIIGGAMAFTFLKVKGMNIGSSLLDRDSLKLCEEILKKAEQKGVKLHFPVDFNCATKLGAETNIYDISTGIPEGYLGFDGGEKTILINKEAVSRANTIVWNGPQGVFEHPDFAKTSVNLLENVIERTTQGAISVAGGGDTVSLIKSKTGASNKISHVSTGGGASLELLEGKQLPGIVNLTDIDQL